MEFIKELFEMAKPVKLKAPQPRGKQVNDVLRSKKGGRHHDAKSDYVRAKEKHKSHRVPLDEVSGDGSEEYLSYLNTDEVRQLYKDGKITFEQMQTFLALGPRPADHFHADECCD